MQTTTTDSEEEDIPRANVLAMYHRAKQLALTTAWLGKADGLRFGQGGMNYLDALLRDVGATHAAARDASNGGYIPAAGFEAAWAALPVGAKNFSLAQMQQFLWSLGIELAPDAVTRCNLDGVVDLEDREFTTVNQHSAPLVQTPIVKEWKMPYPEKLCADCQHLRIAPQRMRHGAVCASPRFEHNPVTGDPARNCAVERDRPNGTCGVEGKLFEQRDPATWIAWVSRPGPLLDAGYTL